MFEHESSAAATGDSTSTVILVGASHANNLALSLGKHFNIATVEMKSWRPNPGTVTDAEESLKRALNSYTDIAAVIYFCLDSAAYCACFEDSVVPARQGLDGVYHIDGDLMLAPQDMFTRSIKICLPLFSVQTAAKKIVLSPPLPRYWMERCCEDKEHVANLEEPGYEKTLFTGLDNFRRLLKDTLFTSGVSGISVYNTSQLCSGMPGSRQTSDEMKDALAILWGDDPVHPSVDCYEALASSLDNLITPAQTSTDTTTRDSKPSGGGDWPAKRPRWLDSEASNTVTPRGGGRGQRRPGGRGFWRPRGRGRGKLN
jgi:hypothetical protein